MPYSLSLILVAIISCSFCPYMRTRSPAGGMGWGGGGGGVFLSRPGSGASPRAAPPIPLRRSQATAYSSAGWWEGNLAPLPWKKEESFRLIDSSCLDCLRVWSQWGKVSLKPTPSALHPLHCLSLIKPWAVELERRPSLIHACVQVYTCLCACVGTALVRMPVCVMDAPSQMRTNSCLTRWFWFSSFLSFPLPSSSPGGV